MKKSFFAFAFALFFGSALFASSFTAVNNHDMNSNSSEVYYEVTDKEFKAIELDDLPQAVKDAAEKEGRNVTLNKAERKSLPNGEYVYRVTMEVEGRRDVTKSFYANGREYKSR